MTAKNTYKMEFREEGNLNCPMKCFSQDGNFFLVDNGILRHRFQDPEKKFIQVAPPGIITMSEDARSGMSCSNGKLTKWQLQPTDVKRTSKTISDSNGQNIQTALVLDSKGKYALTLTCLPGSQWTLWDTESPNFQHHKLNNTVSSVNTAKFSPNCSYIAISSAEEIHIYDLHEITQLSSLQELQFLAALNNNNLKKSNGKN